MLRAADRTIDEAEALDAALHVADDLPPAHVTAYAPAGRYGGKPLNVPAIIITVSLHIALIAGLLHMRHESEKRVEQRLTVVDLSMTPPPSPPPTAKKLPPKTPVVLQMPKLALAQAAPPVVAIPDPPPPRPERIEVAPPAPPAPAPPAPPSVVSASDLGTRMVAGAPPRYPIECRRKREQGTVVLALTLGIDGAVSSISIAHSSGHSQLDDAALRAVRKWRWSPTLRNGQPVMVKGQVEIPFVLQG